MSFSASSTRAHNAAQQVFAVVAFIVLGGLFLTGAATVLGPSLIAGFGFGQTQSNCPDQAPATIENIHLTDPDLKPDQLKNAATIIAVAAGLSQQAGLSAEDTRKAEIIGVAVAIGESGLRILDYGDIAGPDSRGLWQQRNGWGPLSCRMDAVCSTRLFYTVNKGPGVRGLFHTNGWQSMTLTQAAHAVQRNADPNYYTQFESRATRLVDQVAGQSTRIQTGSLPNNGPINMVTVLQPSGDWGSPIANPVITTGFGVRNSELWSLGYHTGADFQTPEKTPIYAIGPGVVISTSDVGAYGISTEIRHPDGSVSLYAHQSSREPNIVEGYQILRAGELIGHTGSTGHVTGPHFHFEIRPTVNDYSRAVDPIAYLQARGVDFGETGKVVNVPAVGTANCQPARFVEASTGDLAPVGTGSIRIATYNVQGTSHTAGNKPGAPGAERMVSNIKTILANDLDVVGLQELQPDQRAVVMRELVDTGLWGIYPGKSTYKNHLSSNSIIWKLSSLQKVTAGVTTGHYRYFGGEDMDLPWVELADASGRMFIVQNTHDPTDSGHGLNAKWRSYNAKLHLREAQGWQAKNLPVFIIGDFNSGYQIRSKLPTRDNYYVKSRDMLPYCIMTSTGDLRNAYDAVHYDYANTDPGPCPTGEGGPHAIEHIYVSPDVQVTGLAWLTRAQTDSDTDHRVLAISAQY